MKEENTVVSHSYKCQRQAKPTQGNRCQEGDYFCSTGAYEQREVTVRVSVLPMIFISRYEWLYSLCENSSRYILLKNIYQIYWGDLG